jgi:transcription initiation factor IIF auxiliary subunit
MDGVQVFKNPSPAFLKILAETGPVPGFDDKKRKLDSEDPGARKKPATGWTGKPVEMERLAAAIEQLEENDLLPIVKIILENQTTDMYVKTDVEGTTRLYMPLIRIEGEFHFDLYTLGNNVLTQLWEYTKKKADL